MRVGPQTDGFATALCNPGEVVIGGGGFDDGTELTFLRSSAPYLLGSATPTGWGVILSEADGTTSPTGQAVVVCAAP